MLDKADFSSNALKSQPPALRLVTSSIPVDYFKDLFGMETGWCVATRGRDIQRPTRSILWFSGVGLKKCPLDISEYQWKTTARNQLKDSRAAV
jgi:hypothetical protein